MANASISLTLFRTGVIFFGICILGLGAQQIYYGDFRPVILPAWPSWMHQPFLAYFVGAALVIGGVLVLLNKPIFSTSLVLGCKLLALFLLFQIPDGIKNSKGPFELGLWTNPLKELALAGGAFIIASASPWKLNSRARKSLFTIGLIFFCVMLICFGVDHFLYADFVKTLVPSWIPGSLFWTYFAAVALIGSGAAILFNIFRRQIGFLLALMLFLWLILLHIPRAIEYPSLMEGNELTSVFEALGFCGVALVIATSGSLKSSS